MKLDLFAWDEFNAGSQYERADGRLRVQLSRPGALMVMAEGYEVCAGFGTSFDVVVACSVRFWAEGPKDMRCFILGEASQVVERSKTVFTSVDMLPSDEGHYGALRRQMREQQLEHRAMMRQMREARDAILASQPAIVSALPVVEPVVETESDGDGQTDA